MTWQGVSEAECYDNRSVIAQIVRIKDRLTAVEQNVDPTLRTDLEAAIAELTALENTVGNVQTQVETNTGNIETLQGGLGDLRDDVDALDTATTAALALKANTADVDADLELKADKTQLTDGSVTKLGTASVGSSSKIMYLNQGVPTEGGEAAILSASGQTFGSKVSFGKGISYGILGIRSIASADKGKWVTAAIGAGTITNGVAVRLVVMIPFDSASSPNGETGAVSVFDITVASENQSAWPFIEVVYHNPGGEVEAVVTNESIRGLVLYVKIPSWASNNSNSNHMKVGYVSLSGLTTSNSSGYFNLLPDANIKYDDVEYNGLHIPNITNYTSYKWAGLTAGHGVIAEKATDITNITYRTF